MTKKYPDRQSKRHLLLTLFLLLFGGAGCSSFSPAPSDLMAPHPFTMRAESSDGLLVGWNGFLTNHLSGQKSTFDLTLENHSRDPWPGQYCVQLVDSQRIIATLSQTEFNLKPGAGQSRQLQIQFPHKLAAGNYGLVLVTDRPGGPSVSLVYIRVGPPPDGSPANPPEVTAIPQEVIQTARAICLPAWERESPVGAAAEDTVRLFYQWYLDFARPDPNSGARHNPLIERAYRTSEYLAPAFIQTIDKRVGNGEIQYDPFLCAQDVPAGIDITETTIQPEAVLVTVKSGLGNTFEVIVKATGGRWAITGVNCAPGR